MVNDLVNSLSALIFFCIGFSLAFVAIRLVTARRPIDKSKGPHVTKAKLVAPKAKRKQS